MKCVQCGAEKESINPRQKYCSHTCAQRSRYLTENPGAVQFTDEEIALCEKQNILNFVKFFNEELKTIHQTHKKPVNLSPKNMRKLVDCGLVSVERQSQWRNNTRYTLSQVALDYLGFSTRSMKKHDTK